MSIHLLYKNFVLVKGKGEDDHSFLNAFDKALADAGIANQNLVPVSSIIPENAKEVKRLPKLKIGQITHCVLARMDGKQKEDISSGLIYGLGKNDKGYKYGIVAEAENNSNVSKLKRKLKERIRTMAQIRKLNLKRAKLQISSIKVKKKYGCVIVALIYH